MPGVLFGLFKDMGTAEKAYAELLAMGVDEGAAMLHRQDVPIAGGHEEQAGAPKPADEHGVLAGLVNAFFDSGNEMNGAGAAAAASTREALHRGNYTVSVRTQDASEMTKAERIFTAHGAVLQLHPDA